MKFIPLSGSDSMSVMLWGLSSGSSSGGVDSVSWVITWFGMEMIILMLIIATKPHVHKKMFYPSLLYVVDSFFLLPENVIL